MAFTEILKVIPKLDGAALSRMEQSLSKRFGKVAKKFGSGLKSAIMGGGITALALGVIDKLLNPLKETQELIDGMLGRADNLSTMAKEFNSSSGNMFKLQTLAQAKGMEPEGINLLVGKFQVAVAEALKDPSKDTSVRNFAFEGADNVQMFFEWVQALQKLPKTDQIIAQQEIFGEKQILKASEFMNANFPKLFSQLVLPSSAKASKIIDGGDELEDLDALQGANREATKLMAGIQLIAEENVHAKNKNEISKDVNELRKIPLQVSMAQMDTNMGKLVIEFELLLLELGRGITSINDVSKKLDKIPGMKMLRGVLPFGKSGD